MIFFEEAKETLRKSTLPNPKLIPQANPSGLFLLDSGDPFKLN